MRPFETQGNTIPQPVEAAQVQQASLASRIGDRVGDLARPLMVGAALAAPTAAFAASEAFTPATADAANSAAKNWKRDNCTNGNLNTVICLGNVVAKCEQIASTSTFNLKTAYIGGSSSKVKVSGTSFDMSGCKPVGVKKLSIWQESRKPGEEKFIRSSNVVKMTTRSTSKFSKTLKAPYSCDQGPIETRLAVGTQFVAHRGTGLKSSKRTVMYQKPKMLCETK